MTVEQARDYDTRHCRRCRQGWQSSPMGPELNRFEVVELEGASDLNLQSRADLDLALYVGSHPGRERAFELPGGGLRA